MSRISKFTRIIIIAAKNVSRLYMWWIGIRQWNHSNRTLDLEYLTFRELRHCSSGKFDYLRQLCCLYQYWWQKSNHYRSYNQCSYWNYNTSLYIHGLYSDRCCIWVPGVLYRDWQWWLCRYFEQVRDYSLSVLPVESKCWQHIYQSLVRGGILCEGICRRHKLGVKCSCANKYRIKLWWILCCCFWWFLCTNRVNLWDYICAAIWVELCYWFRLPES